MRKAQLAVLMALVAVVLTGLRCPRARSPTVKRTATTIRMSAWLSST